MNIQIFGKKKCFYTKAAERFFKERKVKYQFINLAEKGLSAKELENVLTNVKDIDLLFDKESPIYLAESVEKLRTIDAKKNIILSFPLVLVTPIVRDCDSRACTVGNAESTWRLWIK